MRTTVTETKQVSTVFSTCASRALSLDDHNSHKNFKCSVLQRTALRTNCFNRMKPLIRLQKKLTAGFEFAICQTSVADTVFASENNNAATTMFLHLTILSWVASLATNKTRRFGSKKGECE